MCLTLDHLDKPIVLLTLGQAIGKLVHDKDLEICNEKIHKEHFVCNDLELMTHYEE